MVCNRVSLRSFVQTVFFFGYMIGSLLFGILSDKCVLKKTKNQKYTKSILHVHFHFQDLSRQWEKFDLRTQGLAMKKPKTKAYLLNQAT